MDDLSGEWCSMDTINYNYILFISDSNIANSPDTAALPQRTMPKIYD